MLNITAAKWRMHPNSHWERGAIVTTHDGKITCYIDEQGRSFHGQVHAVKREPNYGHACILVHLMPGGGL